MKGTKKVVIVAVVLLLLFCLAGCQENKEEKYLHAIEQMVDGKYNEAREIFQELKDYKDSSKFMDYCFGRYFQQEATKENNWGVYLLAASYYQNLNGFQDSDDRMWKCILDHYALYIKEQKNSYLMDLNELYKIHELNIDKSEVEKRYAQSLSSENDKSKDNGDTSGILNKQSSSNDLNSGYWRLGNFLDSFGDQTGDKFIRASISGTHEIMRNHKKSDITVSIQIYKSWDGKPECIIRLSKNGSLIVNKDTSKTTPYILRIKDDMGNITDFDCHMYKIDDCIVFENNKDAAFINMIMNNEKLKAILMDELIYKDGLLYDYNAYSFTIDSMGFKNAYDSLEI